MKSNRQQNSFNAVPRIISKSSSMEDRPNQDKKNSRKLSSAQQWMSQGAKLLGQVIMGHERGKRSFLLPISKLQFLISPAIFMQFLVLLWANFHWFCQGKYWVTAESGSEDLNVWSYAQHTAEICFTERWDWEQGKGKPQLQVHPFPPKTKGLKNFLISQNI